MYKNKLQKCPMRMQNVRSALHNILQLEHHDHAELLVRDQHTLILLHYDMLTSQHILLIIEQIPNISMTTHKSSHSSSGFIVVFDYETPSSCFKTTNFCQVMVIFCTVWYILTSPFFSCWKDAVM